MMISAVTKKIVRYCRPGALPFVGLEQLASSSAFGSVVPSAVKIIAANEDGYASRTFVSSTNANYNKDNKTTRSHDPTAKRPNKLCDPYGQGGKPLDQIEVDRLKTTIDEAWKVVEVVVETTTDTAAAADNDSTTITSRPLAITREFIHPDYMTGSKFVQRIASVAEMNAHYPSTIKLERKIVRKKWQVITTIKCHTTVLNGLSGHDFHLAMLIDIEIDRPDVKTLLLLTGMQEEEEEE